MPWIVPSHQAPVLPLARLYPRSFSGLGLVLGTLVPDLIFILRLDEHGSPTSHSLLGQLYLTLPCVLALHFLLTALVLPWLLPHVPGGAPLHLHALARAQPATDVSALARVGVSGLVGALSHLFVDGFTHGDHSGWALALLPWLATPVPHPGGSAPLYDALQLWLTIGLGLVALREWDALVRRLPPAGPGTPGAWRVRPAPPAARRSVALGLSAAALAGALVAPLLKGAFGTPDVWKLAAYGFICFASIAAVAGALADRARLAIERVMLDVGLSFEA
jgi:hypothetical protein